MFLTSRSLPPRLPSPWWPTPTVVEALQRWRVVGGGGRVPPPTAPPCALPKRVPFAGLPHSLSVYSAAGGRGAPPACPGASPGGSSLASAVAASGTCCLEDRAPSAAGLAFGLVLAPPPSGGPSSLLPRVSVQASPVEMLASDLLRPVAASATPSSAPLMTGAPSCFVDVPCAPSGAPPAVPSSSPCVDGTAPVYLMASQPISARHVLVHPSTQTQAGTSPPGVDPLTFASAHPSLATPLGPTSLPIDGTFRKYGTLFPSSRSPVLLAASPDPLVPLPAILVPSSNGQCSFANFGSPVDPPRHPQPMDLLSGG